MLPRRYRSVFCIVFLFLVSAKTNAQGFPFDDFLPRTLREIVNENNAAAKDSSLKKDVKSKENFIIDGDPLPSVVRVIYSGKTRRLADKRRKYVEVWWQALGKNPDYLELYDQEMLVKEESTEYWLPVQKQLIPHFQDEIKQGEPVDLFLFRMGGFLNERDWEWMFVVEEFRKPGTENPSIFPWNDFELRTFDQLIALGVKEDAGAALTKNILPSKVRVTYAGESRPVGDDRRKFIETWVEKFGDDPAYGALYERELLFKEGTIEYWLPVAKMIIPRIERDVKKGAELNLYLIRLGGIKTNIKTDWVFLVEEFRK